MNCSYPGVPMGKLCMKECVLPNFFGRFFGQLSKNMKESNIGFFLLIVVIHCSKNKI